MKRDETQSLARDITRQRSLRRIFYIDNNQEFTMKTRISTASTRPFWQRVWLPVAVAMKRPFR